MLAMVHDWQGLLDRATSEEELRGLRGHARTGWPLGDEAFVNHLEKLVGRIFKNDTALLAKLIRPGQTRTALRSAT